MPDNKDQDLINIEIRLVQGCINGDVICQKQLYSMYARKMMGVCLRYANNHDEAEDILQDGFIKVFRNINQYKGEGSLEGWIRRIIVNTALASIRKFNPLQNSTDVQDVDIANTTDPGVISSLSAEDLLKLIRQLSDGYRLVFSLYAIEGYSHKEIASQLNITEGTSKSQFSRARAALQKMVQTEQISTLYG